MVKSLELLASTIKLIGSKGSVAKPAEPKRSGGIPQPHLPDYDDFDDDIPF
jgi:hypothetical protein